MEEKGVSPVVGTILLIAITVALAAVVATLVGGLGGAGAPPNAVLTVSAENTAPDWDNIALIIKHRGGEALTWTDLTLRIGDNDEPGVMKDIDHGKSGSFSVDESVLIKTTEKSTDGVIAVSIIHKPSNQLIFSSTTIVVK